MYWPGFLSYFQAEKGHRLYTQKTSLINPGLCPIDLGECMNKFIVQLLAFKMYVKQFHWLAKGYENHILADKLEEDLDDYIDEAAELYNVNNDTPDSMYAKNILDGASNYLNSASVYRGEDMNLHIDSMLKMAGQIIEDCSVNPGAEGVVKQAYSDYYSRLSNLMVKKCYLLYIQHRKK